MCITVFYQRAASGPLRADRSGWEALSSPAHRAGCGQIMPHLSSPHPCAYKKDQTENTKMHSRPLPSFNLILPALPVTRHHVLLRCLYFNTFFITFQHFFYVFLRLFYDDWFKLFYWGFHFLSKMIQTIFVPDFLTDWFTCSHGLYSKCKILNC